MTQEHENFVKDMLEKAKDKEKTKPQKRADVNPEEVEDILKQIQDDIQKQ